DFWGRAWFWCDHAIAATHLESLLFGMRRRGLPQGTAEAEFHALVTGSSVPNGARAPYVGLSYNLISEHALDEGFLMRDGASDAPDLKNLDPHFENVAISASDLQIGDQVIFWNSHTYDWMSEGDWRLENALVMDVQSLADCGTVDLDSVSLQGHGTEVRPYQ